MIATVMAIILVVITCNTCNDLSWKRKVLQQNPNEYAFFFYVTLDPNYTLSKRRTGNCYENLKNVYGGL